MGDTTLYIAKVYLYQAMGNFTAFVSDRLSSLIAIDMPSDDKDTGDRLCVRMVQLINLSSSACLKVSHANDQPVDTLGDTFEAIYSRSRFGGCMSLRAHGFMGLSDALKGQDSRVRPIAGGLAFFGTDHVLFGTDMPLEKKVPA